MTGSRGRHPAAQPALGEDNTATLHNGPSATSDDEPAEVRRARAQQERFGIPAYVFGAWCRARERAAIEGQPFTLSLLSFKLLGLAGCPFIEAREARQPGPGRGAHFKSRGAGHPCSKPVVTDAGRFDSLAEASRAHRITHGAGQHRIRSGVWRWATSDE